MFKFLPFIILLVIASCSSSTKGTSEYLSYEEIHQRAQSLHKVTITLGELGTVRAGAHERIISDRWVGYSCFSKALQTPKGKINTALCVPNWYKRIYPATTKVQFVYQSDITQRMPLQRALYMEVSNLKKDRLLGIIGTITGVYK